MATAAQKKARAPFNRDVLRWARERVRLSPDAAAKDAGVTPDHIQKWEAGDAVPTIKQARRLATVYALPFMEFLSKERPKIEEPALVPDFRMHRDVEATDEQYELLMIQSEAEETRLNAIDLYELLGITPPALPDEFYQDLKHNPEEAAATVRGLVKLPMAEQYQDSTKRQKIPDICEKEGIKHLGFNELLRAEGIKG